jgi:hypothetical protein
MFGNCEQTNWWLPTKLVYQLVYLCKLLVIALDLTAVLTEGKGRIRVWGSCLLRCAFTPNFKSVLSENLGGILGGSQC